MAEDPRGDQPKDLDASSETELEGRQPYHWPRGPEVSTEREQKEKQRWIALAVVALLAVIALIVYIAQREA